MCREKSRNNLDCQDEEEKAIFHGIILLSYSTKKIAKNKKRQKDKKKIS